MASRSSLRQRGGIGREFEFARGAVKSVFLPRNVVFIVHKPGYGRLRQSIEAVYKHYGITPLLLRPTRFTTRMVRKTYEHIFRKLGEKAERSLMSAYAAVGMNRNIAVEFLHVPQETVNRVGARDAWEAIKKIAGKTNPEEAAREMQAGGHVTIRGNAFVHSPGPGKVSTVLNVVHAPDAARRVISQGYLTGRFTDVDLFVPANVIAQVRRSFQSNRRSH